MTLCKEDVHPQTCCSDYEQHSSWPAFMLVICASVIQCDESITLLLWEVVLLLANQSYGVTLPFLLDVAVFVGVEAL